MLYEVITSPVVSYPALAIVASPTRSTFTNPLLLLPTPLPPALADTPAADAANAWVGSSPVKIACCN